MNTAKTKTYLLSAAIAATIVLSACGGAAAPTTAPTQAPTQAVEPTQAPAATATTEPTMAPEATATTASEPTAVATTAAEATEASTGSGMLPEVDPASVTGDIIVAGSSTVYPLSEWMAEQFKDEGYAGNLTIDSVGSGAGFERFCTKGETDISNASRAINDTEVANCQAIGRTPVEFRVGTDALAIVVNPQNTWADNLTLADLAKIFSGEAKSWKDVNPAWDDVAIKLFSPGTDSGTFDYFVEEVFGDIAETADREAKILNAPGIQLSEDDNVLVQGVAGDKGAIGYFGFAYFVENEDKLRDVSIEGVSPDEKSVNENTYPLSRPLFIYSDAKIMKDKPQVASFINYFLTRQDEGNKEVGYFAAPADAKAKSMQAWLDATK